MPENEDQNPKPVPDNAGKLQMAHLAFELGYIIALPLVGLALLGKHFDAKFGTEPALTLGGIALAIVVTTVWLTRKFKKYLKG
jgi:hypothetical protein